MADEQAMLAAMERAVFIVQAAIEDGVSPAIVVFDSDVPPAGHTKYWQDNHAQAFERAIAARAKNMGWTHGAMAVPVVWWEDDDDVRFREPTPDLPLREGEESMIWVLGFDTGVGYQAGRCMIDYGPDAKPVFGEIEGLLGEITLREAPGSTLLHTLLED